MAEKIYRDLADAIRRVIEYEPERKRAKLGYVYKGEYTIVDPDDQRFYFARFSDGGFVRARHYGKISPVADADVIVVKEKGGHRLEPVLNQWESGENTNVGSSVGYHTHKRGEMFAYEIDLWMLQNMRPTLDNGMVLSVADGFYRHVGEVKHFNGDTIDLTAYIPSTTGHHGWVVVSLDTNTGALSAHAGSTTFTFVDLDQADIVAIDIGDDIPIAALDISNGATEIVESGIVDMRVIPSRPAALMSTSSNTVTLSSDAATLSPKYSFFLIAAQTGTADDLSTLTVTGLPRLIMLQADTGDTITVKHNVGNIKLAVGLDYVLSGDKTLCLFWDGTNLADISPAYPITPLTANLDFDGFNAIDVNTLNLDDSTELTIASGAVTVTQSWHRIDTESDAANDNLDTINGGADGTILYLRAESTLRTVVLRHGAGNIRTFDEQDITLDTNSKCAALLYDAAISQWLAIAIYNAGSGGGGSGYFAGDAYDINYDPLDPADWPVVPVNVGEALDEIASIVSTANPQPSQWVNTTDESKSGTTYSAYTNSAEGTLTAPPTGKIYVTVSGRLNLANTQNYAYTSWELREGSSIGSGTVVVAADDDRAVRAGNTVTASAPFYGQGSHRYLVTGLTPGATYNIRTMHRSSVSLTSEFRALLVEPVL